MSLTNLPTDLLRTFVTVIEAGGYTRAGDLLNRSQPAVSLQLKRLEALLGSKLLIRTGRDFSLTEDGRALAVIARQILRLNDMAVGQFERRRAEESLRVGLPVDYAVDLMQAHLTRYVGATGATPIAVHCDLSTRLLEMIQRDEVDVALALFSEPDQQFLYHSWSEQPFWVAARDWRQDPDLPVPIIAHPDGCEYRSRMTASMEALRQNWRVVFTSPGIQSVQRAVLDGLGVSCMTGPTFLPGMRYLTPAEGFPELPDLRIGLFYKHARISQAGHELVDFLSEVMEGAAAKDALSGGT